MADAQVATQTVTTPRDREQWRAHYAMCAYTRLLPTMREDYTRRAKNLPAMLQNLGLAGTVAFLTSKTASDRQLAGDLSEWLVSDEAGVGWTPQALNAARGDVTCPIEAAIGHRTTSSFTYRRAAVEAKHYATWLKRWSAANAAADPTDEPAERLAGESAPAPSGEPSDSGEVREATAGTAEKTVTNGE